MSLPALGDYLRIGGAKLVLTAISPFQKIFDPPGITHEFCNQQGITILQNDGFTLYAQFLTAYVTDLTAGVYWADTGWKNVSHYFEPISGKGLWQFTTAMEVFRNYYQQGQQNMEEKNYHQGAFFLGAAAHLLQDLCVPHHARGKVLFGHKEYESWVQQYYNNYAVDHRGIYSEDETLKAQLLGNAMVAADLFHWVDGSRGMTNYHETTKILLPRAQCSTAGLFLNFCRATNLCIEQAMAARNMEDNSISEKWRVAFRQREAVDVKN